MSLKEFAQGLVATFLVFLFLEVLLRVVYLARNSAADYVPLPYTVGDDYGPIPPWLDRLRILDRDPTFVWKNRPNTQRRYVDMFSPVPSEQERVSLLRQFIPRFPELLERNPVWEIALNSQGFRDENFPERKSPSAFRIICLGDSWTFGANVGQQETYPQRLKALLKREFPEANFEVFNLGVLGYSSYQGLELLRRTVIHMKPDVLTIGYAWNDSSMAGYRDKDMANYRIPQMTKLVASVSESSESYKLLRYLALLLKYKPRSIGDRLKAEAASAESADDLTDYDKLEPWTRVAPKDYEKNIVDIIDLARSQGAEVILLYNELSQQSRYRTVLDKISKTKGLPLVDSSVLIAEARRRMEIELERKVDLRPNLPNRARPDGEIEVIFRLFADNWPVSKAMYVVGNHPKLANLVPNTIAMYDDGTHGDQRAGDHVWSYSGKFPLGTTLFYVYTNSGNAGKWEGLDVPSVRTFKVEATNNVGKIYKPIESFGKLYMQADRWHTDREGYELIAKALLENLKENEKVNAYLRKMENNSPNPFRDRRSFEPRNQS